MNTTAEMQVPNMLKLLRFAREWGWLLVALMMMFGWQFTTPASKLDAMSAQIRALADSVHSVLATQKEQQALSQWQSHITCRGLTPLERGVAYPCIHDGQDP